MSAKVGYASLRNFLLVSKENLQFLELVFSLKKLAQSATLAHFCT